jgi:type III secretory pathway component EscR
VQSSQKIRDIFVQLQITTNLEAEPLGLILPSCLTRPFVADVADKANTADVAYNNLDNFKEANEVD